MAHYTVFGGRGFIGSEIVSQLQAQGHSTFVPSRDDNTSFKRDLGIVIYCAGNGDCKNTPYSVLEANVSLLAQLLQHAQFERLIYVSSTRVYMNQTSSNELENITVCVDDNRRLFNLTKLVAEELCLKSGRNVCIVRPSNVYGVALNSPLFLPTITRDAINRGVINMFVGKNYAKDYIYVGDVAKSVIDLSTVGEAFNCVINLASGSNVTALDIVQLLKEHTGCKVIWNDNECNEIFPVTDISYLISLIPFSPSSVLEDLVLLINRYKEALR